MRNAGQPCQVVPSQIIWLEALSLLTGVLHLHQDSEQQNVEVDGAKEGIRDRQAPRSPN